MSYKKQSIRYYLPTGVTRGQDNLVNAIIETLENELEKHYKYWTDFDTDPMTCDEGLLDYFATLAINPWRSLWSLNWETPTKRLLLRDTKIIFQKRMFPATINLLFSHFGLRSRLVPKSGLILGVTLLPTTLGTSILDYRVEVPSVYKGLIEDKYTQFIVENFGMPGNVESIYVDT